MWCGDWTQRSNSKSFTFSLVALSSFGFYEIPLKLFNKFIIHRHTCILFSYFDPLMHHLFSFFFSFDDNIQFYQIWSGNRLERQWNRSGSGSWWPAGYIPLRRYPCNQRPYTWPGFADYLSNCRSLMFEEFFIPIISELIYMKIVHIVRTFYVDFS